MVPCLFKFLSFFSSHTISHHCYYSFGENSYFKGWTAPQFISYLNFSNNHLEGPFPAELLGMMIEFNNIKSYIYLLFSGLFEGRIYLNNNHFTGNLPELNRTDFNLQLLNLSSNRFIPCFLSFSHSFITNCLLDSQDVFRHRGKGWLPYVLLESIVQVFCLLSPKK